MKNNQPRFTCPDCERSLPEDENCSGERCHECTGCAAPFGRNKDGSAKVARNSLCGYVLAFAIALGFLVGCGDDAAPLPSCASLGCTGHLLCNGRNDCTCPVDGEAVRCDPLVDAGTP